MEKLDLGGQVDNCSRTELWSPPMEENKCPVL